MRIPMLAAFAVLLTTGAYADGATPWVDDTRLKDQVTADIQHSGILGVESHVADIERVLAAAKQSFAQAHDAGVFLSNGGSDIMQSVLMMSKENRNISVAQNPYPLLALYLGSYYNENRRSEDALRILDLGLGAEQSTFSGLIAERGAALNGLKRFDESLANYDEGLKIPGLDADMKGRFERGRGYALTELGRLDEAEAAYDDSLKDAPGNATAENELRYIAGLKAGAKPAAGGVLPIQKAPEGQKTNP